MTEALYQQALEQIKAGVFAEALQLLNQVIGHNPQWTEAYYHRGRIRAKLQDFAGAIADYDQVIQFQPTAEAFLHRAMAHLILDNPQVAIADAQQARQMQGKVALVDQFLGKTYAQMGNYAQAIAAYKTATQGYLELADKENAGYCIAQIETLQTQMRQVQSSPVHPLAACSTPTSWVTVAEFLQQAQVKFEQEKYAEALTDLNWLLQVDPNHPEALCGLGKVQAKLGNAQAAMQAVTRALQLAPDNPEIHLQRGIVRLFLGDARGAIADFTQLMTQNGLNAQLFLQRGHAYHQLGDLDSAFKDYANALGMAPEDATIYNARAIVQQAMEDLDGALTDYQQAATLWFQQGHWENHQKTLAQIQALQAVRKQRTEAKAAAEAKVVRVPIKYRREGCPVIEVVGNGHHVFDMVVDPAVATTLLSPSTADRLKIYPREHFGGEFADGRRVEFAYGWVQSLAVGAAEIQRLQVAIAYQEIENILGQDFLSHFQVHILAGEIQFHL